MTREPTEAELRVAKAMQDAYLVAQKESWPEAMTATTEELNEINRANWLAAVRAGFRALYEPTAEMVDAFEAAKDDMVTIAMMAGDTWTDWDDNAAAIAWRAMIAAASPEEGT